MSKLQEKKAMLEHQKRDLPCCYPPEREGRIMEIEQLEKEVTQLEKEEAHDGKLDELNNLLVSLLENDDLDDQVVAIIEKHTIIIDGNIKLFKGI